jgi:hypothetical protein
MGLAHFTSQQLTRPATDLDQGSNSQESHLSLTELATCSTSLGSIASRVLNLCRTFVGRGPLAIVLRG